jgi:hypothetical protein
LTPSGGVLLISCGVLLAGGQLLLGEPRRAWPDVLLLAFTTLVPLALATRIVHVPGAASAVCGVYLLPRTLMSLIDPGIEPPPLLLVPALAFDLTGWLRVSDAWPIRRNRWRRRDRTARCVSRPRGALAGAVFGLVLSAVVPPLALLLGGNAADWSTPDLWTATVASALDCALIGLSARGTGS